MMGTIEHLKNRRSTCAAEHSFVVFLIAVLLWRVSLEMNWRWVNPWMPSDTSFEDLSTSKVNLKRSSTDDLYDSSNTGHEYLEWYLWAMCVELLDVHRGAHAYYAMHWPTSPGQTDRHDQLIAEDSKENIWIAWERERQILPRWCSRPAEEHNSTAPETDRR